MTRITFPPALRLEDPARLPNTGKAVGDLQSVLVRLKHPVKPSDVARKEMGASTVDAVKAFQAKAGLPADGKLTPETVVKLNAEMAHRFVADSKTRTSRLQGLLEQAGHKPDLAEVKSRTLGPKTLEALKKAQTDLGVPADGRITQDFINRLQDAAAKTRFTTKTQVGQLHRTLLRALNIAKLSSTRVDAQELKGKKIGPTTKAAIKAVQTKYGLPVTGELDAVTFERLSSIAVSIPEPRPMLRARSAVELAAIKRPMRLNMKNAQVASLQSALAFLGQPIEEAEFKNQIFGKSTRDAVIRYQRAKGLPVTGHVEGATQLRLNAEIQAVGGSATAPFPYRVRGSVRNETWHGMAGVTVQVFEKVVAGQGAKLAERKTGQSGFVDIPYDPPRNTVDGQIKEPYQLLIVAIDTANAEIGRKLLFNPTQIAWVNFTKGAQPYRGTSEFQHRSAAVAKVIGSTAIKDLSETDADPQITHAADATGLGAEDVMRLVLAHRVAVRLAHPPVSADACYAYIAQNLPSTLPGDLIDSTDDWTLIDQLVDVTANGLVFMDAGLKAQAFDNAITLNLMPIAVGLQKDAVIAALGELQQTYALEKPILVGNGSLKGLLDSSSVDKTHYAAVADAFVKHKSFGPEFWSDVNARPADFGGANALADLKTTVEVGHVTKNFGPMLADLKQKIADPAFVQAKSASDLAKLSHEDWVALIEANGQQVPANTDGQSTAEKVQTYAATLANQCERLYPAVSLLATVARSDKKPLPNIKGVQSLIDAHPDFDLRSDNLDAFVAKGAIVLDEATLTEARVAQRVHRIAPTSRSGQALLDNKIHNSSQIVAMGRDRFVGLLTKDKQVDVRTAQTVFGLAEHKYAQVLQRIADYRFDLHRADPDAIIDHTYEDAELPAELKTIPNLETLFGSLDFCACSHCESVYGPAAYLADVLRFLDEHPSEVPNKTVKDQLFERRPDLGRIKLNCENTETPLPYIDLVCEVLEDALAPIPNFGFQTTWSAAELRAAPEHVHEPAYDTLRTADFPLNIAFDLWQEQTRVFLQHLGAPRWELMEAFQSRPLAGPPFAPTDASVAAEYWGFSSHEATIVTAAADNTDAKQKTYWGITAAAIPAKMSVANFLGRCFLDYNQLLDLLSVRWINPLNDANNVVIDRPEGTCDTELQQVINLTADRLDRMHRFLRLWRHVGWAMWELDLALRSATIGAGALDDLFLVRLKQLAQLRKRLDLPVVRALALFGDINAEARVKPDRPDQPVPSLYENLFLNRAVVNPIDETFALPITANEPLAGHVSTIVAAFGLTEADLALLLPKLPNANLTVGNLSKIGRYAALAQGLDLRVKDLLTLATLSGVADIFTTPKTTMDFIEDTDWMIKSAFSVDDLDYLLRVNPDSSVGLRTEVITQYIEALRKGLLADDGNDPPGTMVAQMATALELNRDQAQPLLDGSNIGAKTFSVVLQDPRLVEQKADGTFTFSVDQATFPDCYTAFRALHKAALVIQRLKLDAINLNWLLAHSTQFKLLELNTLPVVAAPAAPLFPAWLKLAKWSDLRQTYPEPEGSSLRDVFDKAGSAATPVGDIKAALARFTQWTSSDVDDLVTALAFQHGVNSDFTDVANYVRLDKARRLASRIGVAPSRAGAWAGREDGAKEKLAAQETRQAAKAKYDAVAWLTKATPLEDALREKRRDALIGYLVAKSLVTVPDELPVAGKTYPNPAYWRDGNDLLKYFLIDVEMSACQLTSRIKQAISSTQMFVQRCLLGLEQPRVEVSRAELQDTASANSWKQWKWMKSYRIWEANRKVFLYPENWIEPELRDDKSPFFKELENEIQQAEITDENVQTAFLHYLQKVHDVSRLDIVGAYYELDDTDPRDNLPPDTNLLHVVGRTKAQPPIYYYRRFDLNYGEWSAWEPIDLDIQSDQVVPVVYNRRLHLFWLTFIEKPQKVKKLPPAKPNDNPSNSSEPPNQLEVQLCWSARKDGGWTAKRVSRQKLIHPWQRPLHSYNLKPRFKSRENLLWLDVYISQSPEFNSTRFWDAYRVTRDFVTSSHPFVETARPWHSSSFLFDGEVVDVRMKPLVGLYHVAGSDGVPNENLTYSSSLAYVHDNFGAAGRAINALSGPYEIAPRLPLPDGMHYQNTMLVNNTSTPNTRYANVLENGQTRTLLGSARQPFTIVASQHSIVFDTASWGPVPFFYQDSCRAFFIRPEWQEILVGYNYTLQTYNYKFFPFYHPYTSLFMRELKQYGLDGLLNRRIQTEPQSYFPGNNFSFASYGPGAMSAPDKTAVKDRVDFERYGAYALYNWEIFFHAPLMIACKLSQNQRFDEAMRWFHYIFDPTNTDSPDVPARYWITRPFFEQNSDAYRQQRIDNLLKNIDQHLDELRAWKNNPFKPHLIASYRPIAYQKSVVMKYLDNLIAWGDQLFRRDTIEAINEATMLYVLAYELLGRRPVKVPNVEHADKSYNELTADGGLDPFGNTKVDVLMENFTGTPVRVTRTQTGTEPLPALQVFYFGIPNNDRLLTYWSTVEDRLFKIRHCMNIKGVVRQLPLFEPPIDPALLVKAAAAGIDLDSVPDLLAAPPAPYRFRYIAQKAAEFCADVKGFGDKLLASLEKSDAEALALLRSSHEIAMQRAVKEIRKQQIKQINEEWASLERRKEMARQKKEYYEGRDFINVAEGISLGLSGASILILGPLAIGYSLKAVLAAIPKVEAGASGFGGTPLANVAPVDGKNLAESANSALQAVQTIAGVVDKTAALASTLGGYQRRQEEWTFQGELATTEIADIDKQIAAIQIRLAIAEKELENQELQIEQSQEVNDYLKSKYTNQQLYDWHVRQVATLYFQSYQLAYDMAKRAEKSFQHERGDATAMFIEFGYWDGLKKGLLAGERLLNDIRRMEAAYVEENTRDLEITKHVSLAQVAPLSLMSLKQAGSCSVVLPEWLFDLDYPGHYFRRLKSVSLSIPCVVGPYTSINCTLSLTNHGIRVGKDVTAGYGDPLAPDTERFFKSAVPQVAIATSHGRDDAGMFELNFNDERFLPFEGAGAVSAWQIDLPRENNQFDLASVSDAILHLRYTARPGEDINLIKAAKDNLALKLPPAGVALWTLDQEFGSEWYRFLHPEKNKDQELTFTVGLEHLPFYARGKSKVDVTAVDLIVEGPTGTKFTVELTTPGGPTATVAMDPEDAFGGRQHLPKTDFAAGKSVLGKWTIKIQQTGAADFRSLPTDVFGHAYLVVGFKTS